jgi:hypothetical protein
MSELVSALLVLLSLLASGLGALAVWMLALLRDGIKDVRTDLNAMRMEYVSRTEFELVLKDLRDDIQDLKHSINSVPR